MTYLVHVLKIGVVKRSAFQSSQAMFTFLLVLGSMLQKSDADKSLV